MFPQANPIQLIEDKLNDLPQLLKFVLFWGGLILGIRKVLKS